MFQITCIYGVINDALASHKMTRHAGIKIDPPKSMKSQYNLDQNNTMSQAIEISGKWA